MTLQRCYNHNFKFLFWQQQIARPPVYDVVTSKCASHFYSRECLAATKRNIWLVISSQVVSFVSGNRKSRPSLKTETLSTFCYLDWSWGKLILSASEGRNLSSAQGGTASPERPVVQGFTQESGVSAKKSWIERELKSQTRKKKKPQSCLPVFLC